jgi:hypothetical protein
VQRGVAGGRTLERRQQPEPAGEGHGHDPRRSRLEHPDAHIVRREQHRGERGGRLDAPFEQVPWEDRGEAEQPDEADQLDQEEMALEERA